MKERINIFQKIIEKPKQIIADIKTFREQQKIEEAEWWNKYLTTPPAEGQPLTKRYESSWGVMGGFDNRDYRWDQESGKWIETARYFSTGYGPH